MSEPKGIFKGWLKKYASSDVIIVGAGPSGLMAAWDLARLNLKTLVIERNIHAGGRLWASDFLIPASKSAAQFKEILDELNIPYKKGHSGLCVNAGPSVAAKFILAACDAGVRILTQGEFKDLIYAQEKIAGVEIDWNPQLSLEDKAYATAVVSLKSQVVIDASGVDACVCQSLIKRGVIDLKKYGSIDIRTAESLFLEKTGLIYPGLACTGMSVAAIYGIPPVGLTLCSLLLSGRKVAQEVEMFFAENYTGLYKGRR